MTFSQIKQLGLRLSAHPHTHKILRILQAAFIVVVCYFLANRVAALGWQDVMHALPTTPWFYVFFILMYFAFPAGEWMAYRRLWGVGAGAGFDIFIRMRIYNYAVVSYSGEAYLAVWGSKNLDQSKHKTFATIKDSNILSALSSNSLTIGLLAVFFMTGQLKQITGADPSYPLYVAVAFGLSAILIPIVISLRKQIFFCDGKTIRAVFGIHFVRLLTVVGLQVAQWAVVMPYVPIETWLLFLTAQYVLTRIPFLPNTDLLFAGVGLTLLSFVDESQTILAGLFVASGALSQILNLGLYAGLSLKDMMRKPPTSLPVTDSTVMVSTKQAKVP